MLKNSPNNEPALRTANESDSAKICEVLIRSVREICAPDYGNDQAILDEWCSNKRPEIVAAWVGNPDNLFIVAEIAPYGIVGAAMYMRTKASVSLCYVVPEGLHKGVGTKLLHALEDEALRLGHKEVTLSSSITARAFYRRQGYEDNGEPIYRGKVLAFPMRKVLGA